MATYTVREILTRLGIVETPPLGSKIYKDIAREMKAKGFRCIVVHRDNSMGGCKTHRVWTNDITVEARNDQIRDALAGL